MKVLDCCEKKDTSDTALRKLTWDEMIAEEGVYQTADTLNSTVRLVVLKFKAETAVLFYSSAGSHLEPAAKAWKDGTFNKTNEKVHFCIK